MRAHLEVKDLSVRYGDRPALEGVSFFTPKNAITAIIGPANSGKTTLLRCINRTIDFLPEARVSGDIFLDGASVLRAEDILGLRRKIGMVFPLPVGLPMSIYDNVAYAPRLRGVRDRRTLDALVEKSLRQAILWDEVKDRLHLLGTRLSGGQQQRLTLARALSLEPELLCLDEFSIAIDPVTTMRMEEVLSELKKSLTILLVTTSFSRREGWRTIWCS